MFLLCVNSLVLLGSPGLVPRPKLSMIDKTIKNCAFWDYAHMVHEVSLQGEQLGKWGEGCSCHQGELLAYASMRRQKRTRELPSLPGAVSNCPFRGCRAPELATGDALKQAAQLHQNTLQLVVLLALDFISVPVVSCQGPWGNVQQQGSHNGLPVGGSTGHRHQNFSNTRLACGQS